MESVNVLEMDTESIMNELTLNNYHLPNAVKYRLKKMKKINLRLEDLKEEIKVKEKILEGFVQGLSSREEKNDKVEEVRKLYGEVNRLTTLKEHLLDYIITLMEQKIKQVELIVDKENKRKAALEESRKAKENQTVKETYCFCRKGYYGKMIGCDDKACELQWFHYDCVGIKNAPQGEWFCPTCVKKEKKSRSDGLSEQRQVTKEQ